MILFFFFCCQEIMRTKRMARQAGEGWSHLTSKQLFADIQVDIAQDFGGGEGRGLPEEE
jgi:hypothetical protein